DGAVVERAGAGEHVEVILAETPFYVESGGQVSDTGLISGDGWQMIVSDVDRPVTGLVVHQGLVTEGEFTVGAAAQAAVDEARRWDIMRNHTATHILHRELRRTLGGHVAQAGSLVAPDRLRFDFSHSQMVSPAELNEIEQAVNAAILANLPVQASQKKYSDLKEAIAAGEIMALFGEKYGDEVRVVSMSDDG
ncbi:MAG: alanine--tRNA ligase, partial [Anaerolineales bacterium]|nr:alanine--tRNA ligase [Anaerolineales bacterium]